MGFYSKEVINSVQDRADIVEIIGSYIPLTAKGQDYWGCCPFHHEKTPSFKVNPALQNFYCFGCHKSGNVFSFIQEKENLDFVNAVKFLIQRYNMVVEEQASNQEERLKAQKKEAIYLALEQVSEWYQSCLITSPQANFARNYLINRGLDKHWIQTFGIGYSPEGYLMQWAQEHHISIEIMVEAGLVSQRENSNPPTYYERFRDRVMFPIRDELGKVVGFSARTLSQEKNIAKYINTAETIVFKKNRILYALNMARKTFKEKGFVLVCEGQIDVIACFRAGLTNAVCSQGTAFTEQHAQLLKRFTKDIVFCFDADKAGIKAAIRSLQIAIKMNLNCQVVTLPDGEDPDSLLKNKGAEALRQIIREAKNALEFLFDYGCKQFDVNTPEGKNQLAELILPVIAINSAPVMQASQLQWLADKLSLAVEVIYAAFNQQKVQNNNYEQASEREFSKNENQTSQITNKKEKSLSSLRSLPLIQKNDPIVSIEKMLLDLALSSEAAANLIIEQLDSQKISKSAIGIALSLVLAETSYGEWKYAKELLIKEQELIQNGDVGQVLMKPQFNGEHDQEYFNKVIIKAIQDCANAIKLQYIERRLVEIKTLLVTEQDVELLNALLQENSQLNQQKRSLK